MNRLAVPICKLLKDPNKQVRFYALSILTELYRQVGDQLKEDLLRDEDIPIERLKVLFERFDEIKYSRGGSRSLKRITNLTEEVAENGTDGSMKTTTSGATPSHRLPQCVESEIFWTLIDNVRPATLNSSRDLRTQLDSIRDILSNVENDWEKRCDALKRLRSIVPSIQSLQSDYRLSSQLQVPLQLTVKDLRSQVVREVCVTIAYMSYKLGTSCGFDTLAETLIPTLISIIQNSAKVMANSSICAICFLIQFTESSRLINPIISGLSSKSKDIRKNTCDFIHRILSTWQVSSFSRHVNQLQDAIRAGIEDADVDARVHSRTSYSIFQKHFPQLSEVLYNSLDSVKKKMLRPPARSNTPASSPLRRAVTPRPIASTVRSKTPCSVGRGSIHKVTASSASQPGSRSSSPLRVARARTPANGRDSPFKSLRRPPPPKKLTDDETSSVSSERTAATQLTTDPSKMISLLCSTMWTDKYNGLKSLQRFIEQVQKQPLDAPRLLTRLEVRRVCDQMVKMFTEAHGKVYQLFLDVLFDFISTYYAQLSEWTNVLLNGLLTKSDSSTSSSLTSQKVNACIDVFKKRFPLDKQFLASMHILSADETRYSSLKFKLTILRYMDQLLLGMMQSADVPPVTNPEMLLGTAAIIHMTADRKSSELRKLSQRVLFSFAQLNNAEFMAILAKLPREFQAAASSYIMMDTRTRPSNGLSLDKSLDEAFNQCNMTLRKSIKRATTPLSNESTYRSNKLTMPPKKSFVSTSTLPRNITTSNFSSSSRLPVRRSKSRMECSTISSSRNDDEDEESQLCHEMDGKLSLKSAGTSSNSSSSAGSKNAWPIPTKRPSAFSEQKSFSSRKVSAASDHIGVIGSVIYQISRQDNPVESRYHHMQCLLSMISTNETSNAWTQHFDNVLFLVLRILFEPYILLQSIALKILQWMLQNQPDRFENCTELTILRLLEFQRDCIHAGSSTSNDSSLLVVGSIPTQADLAKSLEETLTTVVKCLRIDECFQVLRPIAETSSSVCMNLSAIRMIDTMVNKRMSKEHASSLLDGLVASLLVAWCNEQSSIRKAAVFCLVSLHRLVGADAMMPHLVDLPISKLKLLNVYINRTVSNGSGVGVQQSEQDSAITSSTKPLTIIQQHHTNGTASRVLTE